MSERCITEQNIYSTDTPANTIDTLEDNNNINNHRTASNEAPFNGSTSLFNTAALNSLSIEEQILFEKFGCGPIEKPSYNCIHHAFEYYAKSKPNLVAAIHQDKSITYCELNNQANRLARLLQQYGVKNGDNVALFVQRSIPMLVGILACLKAGASYVPQHIGITPESHLRHVIRTASTKVILTLSNMLDKTPVPDGHICLSIDDFIDDNSVNIPPSRISNSPEEPKHKRIRPSNSSSMSVNYRPARTTVGSDTCFIIFTSGTTGKPNGVQVSHENVCNVLLTNPGSLGMEPGKKVSQILNIAFDMAAWEILGCISHGATLIIRGKNIEKAVSQADIVISTPTILSKLDKKKCMNVHVVAVAGEPCPVPLANYWSSFCTFYNACGPTETTIINTAQKYNPKSPNLTIGKPTPNNTVYILDNNLRPCKIGERGVMWAGGKCVTQGYLANPKLNSERYRADPFLGGANKMFNTRDLGRWTDNGELEHLGRVDDQVKIKGFRVELDAVSRALEAYPSCYQAITIKYDNENIISFVTPQSLDTVAQRDFIKARLPYYCIPNLILAIERLPVTSRGKVDKRILLELAHKKIDIEHRNFSLMEAIV